MMQVPAQSQPAAPVDNEVSLAGSGVATTTSKLQAENDGAEDGEVQQEDDSTDKTSISANETSNNGKHSEHQSPMEATVDEEDEDDEILEDSSGNGSEKDEVNDFRSIGDIPAINLKQELRVLSKWCLLSIIVVVPALVMWASYSKNSCPRYHGICAEMWLALVWVLIVSLPTCWLVAKILSFFLLRNSHFLHSNHFFYLIRLHEDIAYIAWAVIVLCFWRNVVLESDMPDTITNSDKVWSHIIECIVAWSVLQLLKDYAVLEVAHRNIWRPYVDRIQQPLFAQYAFILLCEFVVYGRVAKEDQDIALGFSKANQSWHTMSTYAVMRTMSWVPKMNLNDLLTVGPNGAKYGKTPTARGFALHLFDHLLSELENACGEGHRGFIDRKSPLRSPLKTLTPIMNTLSPLREAAAKPLSPVVSPLKNVVAHIAGAVGKSSEIPATPDRELCAERPHELTLWSLQPIMSRQLALEIIDLLDANGDGVVSRDEFALAFVRIYRERHGLSQSLKDFEQVIQKLANIFTGIMIVILAVVCCFIFQLDVAKLAITSISLFVSLSFIFSSTAVNLMESSIFIFVTRAYDVGDVIYFVNNGEAYNCRVTKINLLSTIFLNLADDQWLSIPNQVMAGKQISNRRRGSMGKSKLGITIDAKTPAHIIASMESRMREWAGNVKGLTILPNSIYVLHDDLQDPYTLRLKIVFTQSTSFQEHAQRFKNLGMFTGEFMDVCKDLGVTLEKTPQPVRLDGGDARQIAGI